MFNEYPKWLYDGLEGILVADVEEEAALGAGYTAAPVDPADAPKKRGLKPKE